jgi:hypothetical protein
MIVATIDDGKGVRGKVVAQETDGGLWKVIFLLAGVVTRTAANAKSAVEQHRFPGYC